MIIVSQDKDTVTNFDNIEILGIGTPLEDDEGKFKILANTTSDNQYVIAKYESEERAKEVLQEIKEQYIDSQVAYMEATRMGRGIDIPDCFVYEMPEE